MNPYIGDRPLDPPEEKEICDTCGGTRQVVDGWWPGSMFQPSEPDLQPCPECSYDPEPDPGEPDELAQRNLENPF